MERFRTCTIWQRVLLLALAVMVVAFAAVYAVTVSRIGFRYQGEILMPSQENGATVYAGKIKGIAASFTVSADKAVTFRYGGVVYGPYTAKEDPTAIPEDSEYRENMTGLEIRCGEEILFRGGVLNGSDNRVLYNEDGTVEFSGVTVTSANGTVRDENGNVVDPMEPSLHIILDLMGTPELTHKGFWGYWLLGTVLCGVIAVSILFAEELFQLRIWCRFRNPEKVELSDLAIALRNIGWGISCILVLVTFVLGLQ